MRRRTSPLARDSRPDLAEEGRVRKVYRGTVRVDVGSSTLSNVVVAPPLSSDSIGVGDIVAITWVRGVPYATSILGQGAGQGRELSVGAIILPPPSNLVSIGRGTTWTWYGTDAQAALLAGFEVDAREPGGAWGYGSYPIFIGKQESYSPAADVELQLRIRTVDVYGNRGEWVIVGGIHEPSSAILKDGTVELEADWNAGIEREITVGNVYANTKLASPRADLEQLSVGITGPPDNPLVYVVKGSGQGTPSLQDYHIVVIQSNDQASACALALIGSHENATSLMLGRASKINMVELEYDQVTQLTSLIINDMLSLVVAYDLSMSAVGLSAIDMSAMGDFNVRYGALNVGNETDYVDIEDGDITFTGTLTGNLSFETLELSIPSGDPKIVFDIGGTDEWTIGVDDSDTQDALKFNSGGSLADYSTMALYPSTLLLSEAGGSISVVADTYSTSDTHASGLQFRKSASDTAGTMDETADDEVLGEIIAYGSHSSSGWGLAAKVVIAQDGIAGNTYVPGRIEFLTSDGTAMPAICMTVKSSGRIFVGSGSSPNGLLHVDQESASGAIPVLYLDQADASEEMIEFNTTIGVGNAIEAKGGKALATTHFIKVTLPGGLTRYLEVGTIA